MLLQIIMAYIFLRNALSLNLEDINFGMDYFKYRNVKMICLLTCGKDVSWSVKFSKLATNDLMSVSTVVLNDRVTWERSFYNCLHSKLHSTGVLFDGQCEAAEEALYLFSENFLFSAKQKWLIIENGTAVSSMVDDDGVSTDITLYYQYNYSVINLLRTLNISVDADIVVGITNESRYYTLYEVYNIGKIQGGDLIVNETGNWHVTNGFNLKYDLNEYKYYRRWDFNQWKMRMILVMFPAPKIFDLSDAEQIKKVPGMPRISQSGAAAVNIIAHMHNIGFTFSFADRWVGSFDKNATRVVTNSIYFREQDLSPVMRYSTVIQGTFTLAHVHLEFIETKFYYRISNTGPGKFENKFLRPLSPMAWCGVIIVCVLSALILMLTARIERRTSTFQYAIFSVIALICQQFYEDDSLIQARRSSSAQKTLVFVCGLSCVLIYNYYTSSVVSWLLSAPPQTTTSLWELLDSPLELIFEDIGYTRSWLQTPKYYFYKGNADVEDQLRKQKVFNKKKNAPLFKPLKEGIKMVQMGGYAYHTETDSANDLIGRTFSQIELCELGSLKALYKTPLAACLPKHSPYMEFITWSLMRVSERGFVACIRKRRNAPEMKCEGSTPRTLALGGAAPAFIILAVGYLLATVIMFLERIVVKLKTRH